MNETTIYKLIFGVLAIIVFCGLLYLIHYINVGKGSEQKSKKHRSIEEKLSNLG